MEKRSSKKSKSLEEISNIPQQHSTDKSNLTRGHAARHSLQTVSTAQVDLPLRHTKSQNYGRTKRKVTSQKPETDIIEEEDDESVKIEMESDVRSSQASKKSHRSRSGSGTSRTKRESSGRDNKGYDGTLDDISVVSSRSLERDLRHSGRSSTRASSISLEVQREQYCCQATWTSCEKRLCGIVVVLTTIIIMLLITVAVLA